MTIFAKQSTALDLVVGPFVDDTDFKTAETALTLSQADVQLSKNGAAFAQKNDATSATHLGGGHYKVPLNTTDTNTLGVVRGYINEAGALPVWFDLMVMPANVWDSFFGADKLQVDAVEWLGGTIATPTVTGVPEVDLTHLGGVAQSASDLKDFADDGYDPATNKVQGVVLTDTVTTYTGNTPQTGDAFARIGAAGASLTAVPWNAAWDAEVQSEVDDGLVARGLDHLVAAAVTGTDITDDSIIAKLVSKSATADWDTYANTTDSLEANRDNIGTAGAGLTAIDLPDQTMNITGNITGNLSGSVGSVTGAVGSVTGAVGSVTGAVGSVTGNVGGNVTGSVGSLATQAKADVNAEVVDALNVDTYAEIGQEAPAATQTIRKMLGYVYKAWRNKVTQTSTTYSLFADDTTTVDQKATVSDDGTTYTRGELGSGP